MPFQDRSVRGVDVVHLLFILEHLYYFVVTRQPLILCLIAHMDNLVHNSRGPFLPAQHALVRLVAGMRDHAQLSKALDLLLPHIQVERILLTRQVDTVELGDCHATVEDLAVAQEPPDLSNHHAEALVTLLRFELRLVLTEPLLQFSYMPQHYVLHFFRYLHWMSFVL